MTPFEELKSLCESKLNTQDLRYKKRLHWELCDAKGKEKVDYLLDLYHRKVKYAVNQNNLLVCKLLGICEDFDIEKDPVCEFGDFSDIDVDYLPAIQKYLKSEWAPKTFGEDYVCNISNYTTFGIKSALIDMARVHSKPREEILKITKNLDPKDDEGKALSWEQALRLYPELKKYCEANPEVAEATQKLLNRNRGTGIHAGGLIISRIPLTDLVPLIKRKDAPQASAWVEGLHGQDLQPVGLIKFDLLVINNLLQRAICCRLVKERHNLTSICALPDQQDWTDVDAWRNDQKAIEMANRGDLKCVFQFDSETVRKMAREGGVDRFEDLVNYTSMNRPSVLQSKMDKHYIERKKGKEKYTLHPLLQPILGNTYGILIFQETVMRILNTVGEIPLKDCYHIQKAISKKKIEGFAKYKEMFITNGQKNLQTTEKEINDLWGQIEAFAEYGFCKSHAVAYTYLSFSLLYLKAHYPHEFYAAILSCETLSEKIKEYKIEASQHGVETYKVDLNKSNLSFDLIGDVIYYGISNIKGIGEEKAKRVVEGQPYKSFEDFLERFGTDASVIKPLVGLRCFDDADVVTLWKFAEYYRNELKRHEDKKKRQVISIEKYRQKLKDITKSDVEISELNDKIPEEWKEFDKDEIVEGKKYNCYKTILSLYKRYKKIVDIKEFVKPKLKEFDSNTVELEDNLIEELRDADACERKYYGFTWVHELEKSKDHKIGHTFEQFRSSPDSISAVEIKVLKVSRKEGKKVVFHQVECEDSSNEQVKFNVWQEDWDRWKDELKVGNLLRVRLVAPSGGFPTYTFESPPKHQRWKIPKNKEDDYRLVVMKPAEVNKDKIMTQAELLEEFS